MKNRILAKSALLAAAIAGAIGFSGSAEAAVYSGKLTTMYGSSPTNGAFRVTLDIGLPACTYGFAYVNTADASYQTYVSMLMTAYSMGKTVDLYTVLDANGWCHIVEIGVR